MQVMMVEKGMNLHQLSIFLKLMRRPPLIMTPCKHTYCIAGNIGRN